MAKTCGLPLLLPVEPKCQPQANRSGPSQNRRLQTKTYPVVVSRGVSRAKPADQTRVQSKNRKVKFPQAVLVGTVPYEPSLAVLSMVTKWDPPFRPPKLTMDHQQFGQLCSAGPKMVGVSLPPRDSLPERIQVYMGKRGVKPLPTERKCMGAVSLLKIRPSIHFSLEYVENRLLLTMLVLTHSHEQMQRKTDILRP